MRIRYCEIKPGTHKNKPARISRRVKAAKKRAHDKQDLKEFQLLRKEAEWEGQTI